MYGNRRAGGGGGYSSVVVVLVLQVELGSVVWPGPRQMAAWDVRFASMMCREGFLPRVPAPRRFACAHRASASTYQKRHAKLLNAQHRTHLAHSINRQRLDLAHARDLHPLKPARKAAHAPGGARVRVLALGRDERVPHRVAARVAREPEHAARRRPVLHEARAVRQHDALREVRHERLRQLVCALLPDVRAPVR